MSEDVSKIMHVVRQAPHGTIYPYEGLEMVLIMAAYDQEVSMAFIGDGIFCLMNNQDTAKLEIKGFMKTLGVLDDYDVEQIYVDKQSMEDRGLTTEDFCIDVEVIDDKTMGQKMADQDCIIPH